MNEKVIQATVPLGSRLRLAPATELWTGFTIDDGSDPPVPLQVVEAWECLETPDGERVLRAR